MLSIGSAFLSLSLQGATLPPPPPSEGGDVHFLAPPKPGREMQDGKTGDPEVFSPQPLFKYEGAVLAAVAMWILARTAQQARAERRAAEALQSRIPKFRQLLSELEDFNARHAAFDCLPETGMRRKGTAARFPDMPEYEALIKGWSPFLRQYGLFFDRKVEMATDSDGNTAHLRQFMWIAIDSEKDSPAKFLALLQGLANKRLCSDRKFLMRTLGAACEEYLLDQMQMLKPLYVCQLEGAFENLGRSARAKSIYFLRAAFLASPEGFETYTSFLAAIENQALGEGNFWIEPAACGKALDQLNLMVEAARRTPGLLPLARFGVLQMEEVIGRLEAASMQPDEDISDSGGGVACEEQQSPRAARIYSAEALKGMRRSVRRNTGDLDEVENKLPSSQDATVSGERGGRT